MRGVVTHGQSETSVHTWCRRSGNMPRSSRSRVRQGGVARRSADVTDSLTGRAGRTSGPQAGAESRRDRGRVAGPMSPRRDNTMPSPPATGDGGAGRISTHGASPPPPSSAAPVAAPGRTLAVDVGSTAGRPARGRRMMSWGLFGPASHRSRIMGRPGPLGGARLRCAGASALRGRVRDRGRTPRRP